jgi:antitoxin FitA
MEEEVRQILRHALQGETAAPQQDLASRIRARVSVFGGVDLEIAPREAARDPPALVLRARGSARSRK